ncbi:MAG: (d)CMP kinase [Candidatus Limnocylindrales bacterium]
MSGASDTGRLEIARRGPVVALDGPGSSGKTTVGALAAARLGLRFCDTGLFYRGVAWLALRREVPLHDGPALAALAPEVELEADQAGRYVRVRAAGADVTGSVHGPEIDRVVSEVARQPELRAALLPRQRALAAQGGIVMAGRDIGTVVLPDADCKIYLDASLEERARRRGLERGIGAEDGGSDAVRGILDELRARDALDAGRITAPMRAARDATVLRTDGSTLEQAVDAVVQAVVRSGHAPERDGSVTQ